MSSGLSDKLSQVIPISFGTANQNKLFVGFLESRTVSDKIVLRFDLQSYYREKTLDKARRELLSDVNFKIDKSGIVHIWVENKDPEVAASIANAYLDLANSTDKRANITKAGRERVFLEKRLAQVVKEMSQAEDKLKAFQIENNILDIEAQSMALIELATSLQQEVIRNKVELDVMKAYVSRNDIRYIKLKRSIAERTKQLERLRGSPRAVKLDANGKPLKVKPADKAGLITLKELPDKSIQYIRLYRDAKILENIYELLTSQYEIAKVEEVRDTPTITELDRAVPPQVKYRPKRTLIVMLTFFLTIFFALAYFFLKNAWQGIVHDIKAVGAQE